MAGGKETPRQRMIGILYLVLLGLVALNVPDSLLDAFKNITNSLDQSRENVTTSLDNTYAAFEASKLKEQPEKAAQLLAKAKQASKVSAELDVYIEALKKQLIEEGGGIDTTINDVSARDNLDISPRIMISNKKADELRAKIEDTRKRLLDILGPKDSQGVNFSLDAVDPKRTKKSWQQAYFGDGIPLGATLTTLAKIQADNKNAENEVVKKILGKIDQAQVTLNQFRAVAVAPSSYILAGQQYKADIYLTAYDANSNPRITVGGASIPTKDGIGTYTVTASGEGVRTWTGSLSVKQVEGPDKTYTVSGQYMVSKPSAVVSPDKMNVLYIGVANPVSISAPGVPKESIKVAFTAGSISGSNGKYIVKPNNAPGTTGKFTVTGEKGMVLGASEFRIKRIPDPKAKFANRTGGNVSAANIKAQDAVFATLDNFDFDATFNVTRFTLMVANRRQDVQIYSTTGNTLSPQMRQAINTVVPGSTVIFKDISAVGPDGTRRDLDGSIVLTAQ
ncbi:MAG: gliding motility protein GldM [Sphingobacteriaceae bacterium]|nr:MAG: gliding motility protein GldM [Sphingobacteriaceae bacterium]